MEERGATREEVEHTILHATPEIAKFGRYVFRHDFSFESERGGKYYTRKEVEVFAVSDEGWFVITVIVRYIA